MSWNRSAPLTPAVESLISISSIPGYEFVFFFQAEDGIRDKLVTGVQTCALPICDIALLDRIEIKRNEDDRRGACSRTRRPQRRLVASGEQDVHLARSKLAVSQLVAFDARRLDVLKREIAALLIAQFGHALLEGSIVRRRSRHDAGITDPQHPALLGTCNERPRNSGSRGAKHLNEFPPPHVEHGPRSLPSGSLPGMANSLGGRPQLFLN